MNQFKPIEVKNEKVSNALSSIIDSELKSLKQQAWNSNLNSIETLDKIYAKQETQLDGRLAIVKKKTGKHLKEKTACEERIEELEERLVGEFKEKAIANQINNVAELENKMLISSETEANKEKLKGRFRLRINPTLDLRVKIGKYA